VANSLCHHYDRDKRQQTGSSPAVPTLLKLKREKAFGERGCKISVLASKLHPFARAKAHASELWGLSKANGKSSRTQLGWSCLHRPPQVLLSMPDARWKLQANQTCRSLAPQLQSPCCLELPPCDSFHSQGELCPNLHAEIHSLIFHSTDNVFQQNRTKLLI